MPMIGPKSSELRKVPLSTTAVWSLRLRKPCWPTRVVNASVRRSPGFIGVSKAKMR